MFRYVALAWDPLHAHASSAARQFAQRLRAASSEWRTTLDCPGLLVLHAGAQHGTWQVYALSGNAGVVFGKLFTQRCDREGFGRVTELSALESAKIVSTQARALVDQYWGRYVAIVRERETHRTHILRDPQGGLACYLAEHCGVRIFFSHLEECLPDDLFTFSINEAYLAAHVCDESRPSACTALNEIAEVLPGECCHVDRSANLRRTLYWQPAQIACSTPLEDPIEAAHEVHRLLQRCVWSWARDYTQLGLNLSGGLDSTCMLSALTRAPHRPHVTCIHYFSTTTAGSSTEAGDERRYARLAASLFPCELLEIEHCASSAALERLTQLRRSPRPRNYQSLLHHTDSQRRIAQEHHLQALFDGSMGDQLFGLVPPELCALDYLWRFGMSRKFVRSTAAAARRQRTSAWSLLARATWKYARRRRDWRLYGAHSEPQLVRPELRAAASAGAPALHPWLRDTPQLPPGKRCQITGLTACFTGESLIGLPAPWEHVPALCSQPLVELCLRIPVYVLSPHGAPRRVQRLAFVEELPRSIIQRTGKGTVDDFLQQQIAAGRRFLREFLLDGWLAAHGWLDRVKLEALLSEDSQKIGPGAAELMFEHLNTEAWVRSIHLAALERAA